MIRLTADHTKIKADKNDLSYVKVEILDKNEKLIPDCSVPLKLNLPEKGPSLLQVMEVRMI